MRTHHDGRYEYAGPIFDGPMWSEYRGQMYSAPNPYFQGYTAPKMRVTLMDDEIIEQCVRITKHLYVWSYALEAWCYRHSET